jgi:hypothetical protein
MTFSRRKRPGVIGSAPELRAEARAAEADDPDVDRVMHTPLEGNPILGTGVDVVPPPTAGDHADCPPAYIQRVVQC